MTAEQQFKKLGFEKFYVNDSHFWYTKYLGNSTKITLEFSNGSFEASCITETRKKIEITSYELNRDLLKAVVKQLKEIKWA